jgi:hypothetical protein
MKYVRVEGDVVFPYLDVVFPYLDVVFPYLDEVIGLF